jgi:hypothetical protein
MYGTSGSAVQVAAKKIPAIQAAKIVSVLQAGAYGVDIIEAGYRERGGMPLEAHLAVWDACSRNGIVTTANGVNDNHLGTPGSWATEANRFLTSVWAASSAQQDLLTALATGRAFISDQATFAGTIDLVLDDGTPMGGVTRRGPSATRQLTILASALPPASYFEVIKGVVDFAGPKTPTPGTTVVATVASAALASGSTTVSIPTASDCFYRLNLVDTALPAASARIAFSNPVWIVNAALPTMDPRRQHHPAGTTVALSPAAQTIPGRTNAHVAASVAAVNGAVPGGTLVASLVNSSGNQIDGQQFPAGSVTYTSPVLDIDDTYTLTVWFIPADPAADNPSSATATVVVSG